MLYHPAQEIILLLQKFLQFHVLEDQFFSVNTYFYIGFLE